ncbi:autophagy-related protein 2 [Pelomyxa schiedti]|nr:autophagy-related protein 2 [Pelomyxa schiedti]
MWYVRRAASAVSKMAVTAASAALTTAASTAASAATSAIMSGVRMFVGRLLSPWLRPGFDSGLCVVLSDQNGNAEAKLENVEVNVEVLNTLLSPGMYPLTVVSCKIQMLKLHLYWHNTSGDPGISHVEVHGVNLALGVTSQPPQPPQAAFKPRTADAPHTSNLPQSGYEDEEEDEDDSEIGIQAQETLSTVITSAIFSLKLEVSNITFQIDLGESTLVLHVEALSFSSLDEMKAIGSTLAGKQLPRVLKMANVRLSQIDSTSVQHSLFEISGTDVLQINVTLTFDERERPTTISIASNSPIPNQFHLHIPETFPALLRQICSVIDKWSVPAPSVCSVANVSSCTPASQSQDETVITAKLAEKETASSVPLTLTVAVEFQDVLIDVELPVVPDKGTKAHRLFALQIRNTSFSLSDQVTFSIDRVAAITSIEEAPSSQLDETIVLELVHDCGKIACDCSTKKAMQYSFILSTTSHKLELAPVKMVWSAPLASSFITMWQSVGTQLESFQKSKSAAPPIVPKDPPHSTGTLESAYLLGTINLSVVIPSNSDSVLRVPPPPVRKLEFCVTELRFFVTTDYSHNASAALLSFSQLSVKTWEPNETEFITVSHKHGQPMPTLCLLNHQGSSDPNFYSCCGLSCFTNGTTEASRTAKASFSTDGISRKFLDPFVRFIGPGIVDPIDDNEISCILDESPAFVGAFLPEICGRLSAPVLKYVQALLPLFKSDSRGMMSLFVAVNQLSISLVEDTVKEQEITLKSNFLSLLTVLDYKNSNSMLCYVSTNYLCVLHKAYDRHKYPTVLVSTLNPNSLLLSSELSLPPLTVLVSDFMFQNFDGTRIQLKPILFGLNIAVLQSFSNFILSDVPSDQPNLAPSAPASISPSNLVLKTHQIVLHARSSSSHPFTAALFLHDITVVGEPCQPPGDQQPQRNIKFQMKHIWLCTRRTVLYPDCELLTSTVPQLLSAEVNPWTVNLYAQAHFDNLTPSDNVLEVTCAFSNGTAPLKMVTVEFGSKLVLVLCVDEYLLLQKLASQVAEYFAVIREKKKTTGITVDIISSYTDIGPTQSISTKPSSTAPVPSNPLQSLPANKPPVIGKLQAPSVTASTGIPTAPQTTSAAQLSDTNVLAPLVITDNYCDTNEEESWHDISALSSSGHKTADSSYGTVTRDIALDLGKRGLSLQVRLLSYCRYKEYHDFYDSLPLANIFRVSSKGNVSALFVNLDVTTLRVSCNTKAFAAPSNQLPGIPKPESAAIAVTADVKCTIEDHMRKSTWKTMFATAAENVNLAHTTLLVYPNMSLGIEVEVSPLKLFVDQAAFEFIVCFLTFDPEKKPFVESSESIDYTVDSPQTYCATFHIKKVEVEINYRPFNVKEHLIKGVEAAKLFPLQKARLTLREIKLTNAILPVVVSTICQSWFSLSTAEVLGFFWSLKPVKYVTNLTERDTVSRGNIVNRVGVGVINAATGVTKTAHGALTRIDHGIVGSSDYEQKDSIYADQPKNLAEGLVRGAGEIVDGVCSGFSGITVELFQEISNTGVIMGPWALVHKVPGVVIRPAIGVAGAATVILLGGKNSLMPKSRRISEKIYKKAEVEAQLTATLLIPPLLLFTPPSDESRQFVCPHCDTNCTAHSTPPNSPPSSRSQPSRH